jgi:hypothetical protein
MIVRISDTMLVVEAIRRARLRKVQLSNGSYQGSRVNDVINLLEGWIDPKELTETCNFLMRANSLIVTATKSTYTPTSTQRSDRESGRLDSFHPDTGLKSDRQYFSKFGTPLGTSKKNGCLRVHSEGKPYLDFGYRMFYLTVDGIPDTVPKNYIQV